MKKTYLARRNALLTTRNVSWGLGALLFALALAGLRLAAPSLFLQAFAPAFHAADALSASADRFASGFADTAALAEKNSELVSENAALTSENAALLMKVENLAALAGPGQKAASGITAGVVERPPESPYDVLVVAAGKEDGVVPGMEAFGAGGVPIGVVSTVLGGFSRVTLFSAPGTVTTGSVGHANVALSLTGAGGGVLTAVVARAANIAEGDTVFVPGPGMLPVGTVVRVESNPLSPGITLRILPATNLFSTAWVTLRATGVVPAALATSTLPL